VIIINLLLPSYQRKKPYHIIMWKNPNN